MRTYSVEHWKANAENGILHEKAGYVLKSSKELTNMGKQDDAEVILKSALKRRSWDELSEIKMLTSLSKLIMEKDPSEVLQLIDESTRKDPGLILMKATALGNLNRAQEAINTLEKEIDSNPGAKYEPDIASKLSILYRQVGNDQKTVEFLAPIIGAGYFQNHLLIKQILADAYIRTRKADKALPLLDGEQDWRGKEMIERAHHALGGINLIPNDGKPVEIGGIGSIPIEIKSKRVWVIHGRNEKLVRDIFSFLRAINLDPIEWSEARAKTGVSSPYIGDILKAGFNYAQAFVVLLTGDDEAKLRPEYIKQDDPGYERILTPQARQNVIFEAGMAFGRDSDKVIFVRQGHLRPFSNISGIHVMELNDTPEARMEFAKRLMSAGCSVPDLMTRHDWLKIGNFELNVTEQSKSDPTALAEATKSIEINHEAQENPTHLRGQLTRKYDRLNKEMDGLIGPLFSKIDDHTAPFFAMVYHSQEAAPRIQEIYAFWRDIKMNAYLAPSDLRESLNNYLEARQQFRMARLSRDLPAEQLTAAKATFDQTIDDLKPKIKDRYEELIRRLEECEKELES
jgi:tetratricopeptide (TPR) repeat protein